MCLQQVNACKTSEEVVKLIREDGYDQIFTKMRQGCETRIRRYVKDEEFQVDVILYSMEYGRTGEIIEFIGNRTLIKLMRLIFH